MQHGQKVTLTDNEKTTIIQGPHGKQTTLQIAKKLNCDHRTIKKVVLNQHSLVEGQTKVNLREDQLLVLEWSSV